MAEFFAMGGYAAYIWPAWGVGALVLAGLLVASLRSLKSREATLKALEESRPRRRRRRDTVSATSNAATEGGEG
ncbi:MAG TPA: heme exporter protein CcmD [Azospirillaceae bacterium]|nr:heme exporter protein CcmD [Azospirillaceae bacterium]